jgi:FeS assembly SUF system protein
MDSLKSIEEKMENPSTRGQVKPLSFKEQVIDALRMIHDPEVSVNIYDLGLVYAIDIKPDGATVIRMTLMCPGCPVAGTLPFEVKSKVLEVPGITSVKVEVVRDPPWNPDMISDVGKLQLGIF